MQKFEILYNRAYSASTQNPVNSALAAPEAVEAPLFQTQQNISFQQEYFLYLQQNGVSLVNDLNVKGYLNDPKNESLATEFINYLSGACSFYEFTDVLYDSKKLAEYFNDYYRKFNTFSNQGIGSDSADSSINLSVTKSRVLQQDRLYAQTNSLSNYFLDTLDVNGQLLARNNSNRPVPLDVSYFSGTNESYYVNIMIESGRKTFFSDDFSQYYQDCCDGTIVYNKYTYLNNISESTTYGNLSALQNLQGNFNLTLGPSQSSVEYIRSFLPVNFLFENEMVQNESTSIPVNPSTQAQLNDYSGAYGYVFVPQSNNQILNFMNFSQFETFFGFQYMSWTPQFSDPAQYNNKYIYDQTLSYVDYVNFKIMEVYNATRGRGSGPPPPPPTTYKVKLEQTSIDPSYKGQLFDPLNTNTYRIRVLHTSQSQSDNVILAWEPFSVGTLGADDGINSVSFDINGNVNPNINTVSISFAPTDLYQDVYINLYKNLSPRTPIVFSLRPQAFPNVILEYVVIYLEEFYSFKSYNSTDQINVTSSEICKLMYNCFVDRNFNDNFLEFQRPDTMPVNFINTTGLTLQQGFDMANTTQVNSKLLSVFNNNQLDLSAIAFIANVPISGIYNIYVWGSYLFGTEDAYSDVDLIVVADGQMPVRQIKDQGVDIAIYTPQRFQQELQEVVIKMMGETVSSDRVFTIYNSSDPNFKVLERITFTPNSSKAYIKTKVEEFKQERWKAVEDAFFMGDTESWKKRLWSIFRNIIFATQFIRDGKITDLSAAKQYLDDINSKSFTKYSDLVEYFNPKISNLYSVLLSL